MSSPVFSLTLSAYFEETYLPQLLEHAPSDTVKRFRNAIGRASLFLGHTVTLGDLVDPSFSKSFVEHLLEKGFTAKRAKSFATCLREIQDGAREHRKARARQPEIAASCIELHEEAEEADVDVQVVDWRVHRSVGVSPALLSILEPGDQVCGGGFDSF
jgi:hypothetical protein